jgi:hypothetical protein
VAQAFADDNNWIWSSGEPYSNSVSRWNPDLYTDGSVLQTPLPFACVGMQWIDTASPPAFLWGLYDCDEVHRCVRGLWMKQHAPLQRCQGCQGFLLLYHTGTTHMY